nr:hypothetical protein CFP56_10121 [Quercus suber]
MDSPTTIRYAKLLALPLPFLLGGYSLSLSHAALPAFYDTHPTTTSGPLTNTLLSRSGVFTLPLETLSAGAAAYLAYILPAQRRLWTIAAAATFAAVPYTVLFMVPGTMRRLREIAESTTLQEKTGANLEFRQVMKRWVGHNYVRVAMFFGGGVVALKAAGLT